MIDDVDALDKDNKGWTKAYVKGLEERLARERAHDPLDGPMVAYLEGELATYQALLSQAGG